MGQAKAVKQTVEWPVIWDYMTFMWCHHNGALTWNSMVALWNYSDVRMGTMASQITRLAIVYSTVYSGADQRKHQSCASLAFVWGIHRWTVNSSHEGPLMRKMFPFDDVIMGTITHIPGKPVFLKHFEAWTNWSLIYRRHFFCFSLIQIFHILIWCKFIFQGPIYN